MKVGGILFQQTRELQIQSLSFCGKCEKVMYELDEIEEKEKNDVVAKCLAIIALVFFHGSWVILSGVVWNVFPPSSLRIVSPTKVGI